MKHLFLSLLLLSASVSFGQGPATNWYFHYGGGLDFSGSNPVSLNNGMIGPSEGTAAISDSSGKLLFYTEGVTIWDQSHAPMLNGNGLTGNISTTQSALIVPQPGDSSHFFVFTLDQTCGPNGLRYSVVDMDLNAGLGGVVAGQKNAPLLPHCLEKLAAVHHCNGRDVWVMAIDALTGGFHAWLVTGDGICDCPVVSLTGPPHGQGFGCMKFSNDGKQLVVVESEGACNGPGIHSDLYNFDNNTGEVFHVQTIDTADGSNSSSGGRFFGASFSPDNQVLYLSTGFSKYNGSAGLSQGTAVVQYDLNSANIESSAVLVFDNSLGTGGCGSPMGSMQLGPDGRIYVGNSCNNGQGMDVIQNPNALGLACNFVHGGVPGSMGSGYGITNFIESYFGQGVTACDTVLSSNMCDWLTEEICPPVVGADLESALGGLRVYPNPVSGKVAISFPNPLGEGFRLELYDSQGRLVIEKELEGADSVVLDSEGMKSGIHWIVIRMGGEARFKGKVFFL